MINMIMADENPVSINDAIRRKWHLKHALHTFPFYLSNMITKVRVDIDNGATKYQSKTCLA